VCQETANDESGQLLPSRWAVSERAAQLWTDYQEFDGGDSSEYDIVYLFVDRIAALKARCRRQFYVWSQKDKQGLTKLWFDRRVRGMRGASDPRAGRCR